MSEAQDYLAKAQESLAGAESELAHHRFNSCARSAYSACFQATSVSQREAVQAVRRAQEFVQAGTIYLSRQGKL